MEGLSIEQISGNVFLMDYLAYISGNKHYFVNGQVYLVGYVPSGVDERRPNSMAFKEHFNRRYLRLVRKYSQVIVGQFFGHHHSDSFRVIYNERGLPISWMFLAPSVTPWRTPSGANNPGLRLYKFDTDMGQDERQPKKDQFLN